MSHFRPAEEIRRFDLMKLGVLILLILLLILTWLATRHDGGFDLTGAEPTTVAEATLEREPGDMPFPTLVPPAIDVPVGQLAAGAVTLSGRAGPGAQVAVLAGDRPLGLATVGVDGVWALTTDLPAGQYTLVAQTIDNVGTVVAESAPLTITVGPSVGDGAATGDGTATGDAATAGATGVPATAGAPDATGQNSAAFDPLSDTWTLSGTAAPGSVVAVLVNGAVAAQTSADAGGVWTLDAPGANLSGDVIIQSTDATGAAVSAPLTIGARPPSVAAPGQTALTATGPLVVPAGPGLWSGQAVPGTQVEVIVDDQSAGATTVDPQGNWSLSLALPPGQHTLRFNSLDVTGALLASGPALSVAAGDAAAGTPVAGASPAPGTTPGADATPAAGTAAAASTLLAALGARPEFTTLASVIDAAGMSDALAQPGPFTLFAPTNDAFDALPQSVIDTLLANPDALAAVLRYHVAQGRYTANDLRTTQPSTIDGRLLTIGAQAEGQAVNGVLMSTTDIAAGNGIIHAVDAILLPPLAAGVRPPVIDESGVPTFLGPRLTVVGSGEPGRTIRVELNGEAFGDAAVVDANGRWQVTGDVSAADYRIVAFMLNGTTLEAFSRPVALTVR